MAGVSIQLRLGTVGDHVLSQMEGEVPARHRRNSSRCGIYSGQADVRSDASPSGSAGRPAGGERGRNRQKGAGGSRPVSDGSDDSGPPLSPISSSRARDSLEPLKKQTRGYRRKRKITAITAITANTYSADHSSYCRSDSGGGLQTRSVSSRVISAVSAQLWLLTAKHIVALIMAAKIRSGS